MRVLSFFFLVLVAMLAAPLTGQSLTERFERVDVDRDGKVTPDELPRPRLFKLLDRNGDGFIERHELVGRVRRGSGTAAELKMPDEPPHTVHRNIQYARIEGVEPNLLSFDMYVPKGPSEERCPVMIMIHGGGWRNGDKANASMVGAKMRHFVGRGYIYVSINYRLTTQRSDPDRIKHPIHAEDCARAIAYLHATVDRYGGDPDRLHLMGHSAGAHLAGIVGTNERFLEAEGKDLSILKTNVLLDTAAIDIPRYMRLIEGRGMSQSYQLAFGNDEANWRDASPALHVAPNKSIPPTLVFYGGQRMKLDVIAPAFTDSLTEAGAPSQSIDTVDLDHGQINSRIGMIGDPMTELIMRLHTGEDATRFPSVLPGKRKPNPH